MANRTNNRPIRNRWAPLTAAQEATRVLRAGSFGTPDAEDTGPLLDETDPSRWVRFPEDHDEPAEVILGESLAPEPRPRPSEMPTARPGPSPFTGPSPLPPRAPRPRRGDFDRAPSRPPPSAPRPGDLRSVVRARQHRSRPGRFLAWLAAWVFLIAVPGVVAAILVPAAWQWMLAP